MNHPREPAKLCSCARILDGLIRAISEILASANLSASDESIGFKARADVFVHNISYLVRDPWGTEGESLHMRRGSREWSDGDCGTEGL